MVWQVGPLCPTLAVAQSVFRALAALSHSLGSLSQAGRLAANSTLRLSQLGDLGTQSWWRWQTGTGEGVRDEDRRGRR